MRSFMAIGLFAAACATDGCTLSTSPDDNAGASARVDVNDPAALKSATDIEGTVAVGKSVTVGYEKAEYSEIPYLAVQLAPSPRGPVSGPSPHVVTVVGAFPGTPEIYAVDGDFAVVERTSKAVRNADGTTISTLTLPDSSVDRTIIVHDSQWSSPMQFLVSVSP